MRDRGRRHRVAAAVLIFGGVMTAFATSASGAPFWLVFAVLLLSWLGAWLAGR